MIRKRLMLSFFTRAAAGCLALLVSAGVLSAANVPLLDANGQTIGWTVTVPDSSAGDVTLRFSSASGNRFFFVKDATIRSTTDPLILTFTRTSTSAPELVIQNEILLNSSGSDWSGFRTFLSSGSTGGTPQFSFVTSDNAPGLGDFNIDPFTSFSFLSQNTELFVNGGTVAKGDTWRPGSASGTGLAIVTSNSSATTFQLKELPQTAGGGTPNNPIPVPAAAWMGLSTLIGLGLLANARKLYLKLF